MKPVVIIGNGPSREGFDLSIFIDKATTIGCNAVYRDFPDVDWIAFIDEGVADELKRVGWAPSKTILPSQDELYEPAEYNPPYRFKNNAGALAITKTMQQKPAANREPVYLIGIDCFLAEGDFLGNVYLGTENFDSKVSFEDQMRRVKYIDWLCGQYPHQKFVICVPDETKLFQEVQSPNIVGLPFSKVKERFTDA
jgi:hypothetical protein